MSEHHILFSSPINVNTVNEFAQLIVQIQQQGATKVYIAMHSPGGQVISGIMMYNLLKSLPLEVTTHNIGNVDSIANAVFLAGSKRYACSAATFMFHGVGFDLTNPQRLEEKALEGMLDTVIAEHKRISSIMSAAAGIAFEDCMALFKEQKTRDAAWAKEQGIVAEIREFAFPVGGNLHLFIRQ